MYYIYRITNLINGKTYIGQHKYKKLNDSYMGSGIYLAKAKKKYGIENFKKEILVFNILKKEHIDLLEKTFIASEREKVGARNCYNIAKGGEGGNGGNNKGHIPWNKGKKGLQTPPNKGIPLTEEQKKNLSKVRKGLQWFNNGEISIMRFECPEGFTPGRIYQRKKGDK